MVLRKQNGRPHRVAPTVHYWERTNVGEKGIIMFHSKSTEDTEKFAASIALKYGVPHTFCLSGELGAGKTAFTRGIARGCGYDGRVSSPTFTIMNIYEGKIPVHHFDLYRLSDEEELFGIGFDPLADGVITVVEWFDGFADLFRGNATLVKFTKTENENERYIEVTEF